MARLRLGVVPHPVPRPLVFGVCTRDLCGSRSKIEPFDLGIVEVAPQRPEAGDGVVAASLGWGLNGLRLLGNRLAPVGDAVVAHRRAVVTNSSPDCSSMPAR